MKRGVILALSLATFFCCSQFALAGRIVLTGHDDDSHQSAAAATAINAFLTYVRATAPTPSLPVLTFDHGTELTGFLTTLGVTFVNVDPNAGVPAASNFDVKVYSAMIVASDTTCGGCDNDATSSVFADPIMAPRVGPPPEKSRPGHSNGLTYRGSGMTRFDLDSIRSREGKEQRCKDVFA